MHACTPCVMVLKLCKVNNLSQKEKMDVDGGVAIVEWFPKKNKGARFATMDRSELPKILPLSGTYKKP